MLNFTVLTLNCWGVFVPGISPLRKERFTAIGEKLRQGEYDICLLQEVWTQADYELLKSLIHPHIRYSHYFHCGIFGSGLCIFTRFPIIQTFQHRYSPNGWAHMYTHCDWYSGKAIGLAVLQIDGYRLNAYVTHTHADYGSRHNHSGPYEVHRLIQAQQMSTFVKLTSDACDAVILAGDFNFKPDELGYHIVRYGAELNDAWVHQKATVVEDDIGATSCSPLNTFTKNKSGKGKRIDYILYKNSEHTTMTCQSCTVCLQQIPEKQFSYSDHCAVAAVFTLYDSSHKVISVKLPSDKSTINSIHTDLLDHLDRGLAESYKNSKTFAFRLLQHIILFLLLVLLQVNYTLPYGSWFIVALCIFVCMARCVYFLCMIAFDLPNERNSIKAVQLDTYKQLHGKELFTKS